MVYTIVCAKDVKTLIDNINDMIANGWETEGGVAIASDGTYCQAMLLWDEDGDEFETGQEL